MVDAGSIFLSFSKMELSIEEILAKKKFIFEFWMSDILTNIQ